MVRRKKTKNNDKATVLIIIVTALALAGLAWLYHTKDNNQTGTAGWLTYKNQGTPFSFDYPPSWNLTSKTATSRDGLITYQVIAASNKSTKKEVIEVRYYTYVAKGAVDTTTPGPDCQNKRGDYKSHCSYIQSPLMQHGYFYHKLGTDNWNGEYLRYNVHGHKVFDKTVSITLTLLDNNEQSKDNLVNLAESITNN